MTVLIMQLSPHKNYKFQNHDFNCQFVLMWNFVCYTMYQDNIDGGVEIKVLIPVFMNSSISWDIIPCSSLKIDRRFGGTYRFQLQGRRWRQNWRFSETSVDCQRTTQRYIPEGRTIQRLGAFENKVRGQCFLFMVHLTKLLPAQTAYPRSTDYR
jgi:hypothetical protein